MKRSIASVCLSGDLRQKIEAASYAGFDAIEIFENDLMLFDESPKVVQRMAEDAELNISAFQPFRDFECMPSFKMQKNFDRAERKFDLMEELATDTLLICSNVSPQSIDDIERAAEEFSELAERAAQRGIKLGYEALAWGRNIRDYQVAWNLVKRVDHKHFGIILDSFHIFARSKDLSGIADIPGDRITLVQVADAPWLAMDELQWSRHYRCFPGQGDFPIVEFINAIIDTGYSGYFSHEIFNDEFRSSPCRATAVDGMRSMLWLQEQVVVSSPDVIETESDPGFYQPPSAQPLAIEFVEFAAEGEASEELIELLTNLGFRKTHIHRSKDVSLFRQGDVCIIINEEPDSFAQNYYLIHGASVCAVAYLTDDAEGMAERAAYYGYRKFESDVESGELNIPAIHSNTGELAYFVQKNSTGTRFYDIDFTECNEQNSNSFSSMAMQIDHITSSVSESEFLPTSLYYRVLFGLEIDQPKDLIDPYGIVVSRTATNKNKKIRLPFNMSRSWGASPERFREQHRGSGVQHIALRCENILEFAQAIDQNIVLPIPENYYDDLEARYELEPELAENLRQFNLLYDQTQTGHYIHFYTQSINGVFFEIVERQRYGNYGEVNAQVRMAAQSRVRKSRETLIKL